MIDHFKNTGTINLTGWGQQRLRIEEIIYSDYSLDVMCNISKARPDKEERHYS